MRNYFSTRLLWTAFHASDRAREIEAAHTGNSTFDIEHNAYVLSAVVSSAGFLEAAINEFFQDAHDGHGLKADEYLAPLPADAIEAMAATWRDTDQGFRLNALEKWQLMLTFAGRAALDRGAAPFQDAQSVTLLRNAILHFRPEDMGGDDPTRWRSGSGGNSPRTNS